MLKKVGDDDMDVQLKKVGDDGMDVQLKKVGDVDMDVQLKKVQLEKVEGAVQMLMHLDKPLPLSPDTRSLTIKHMKGILKQPMDKCISKRKMGDFYEMLCDKLKNELEELSDDDRGASRRRWATKYS